MIHNSYTDPPDPNGPTVTVWEIHEKVWLRDVHPANVKDYPDQFPQWQESQMTKPRQIVQVCSDFHHASSYIALCNDGTVWYGTHKVVHDEDGEYKPSPTYWVRLPDIPQGESDDNRLDELEGRDRPTS